MTTATTAKVQPWAMPDAKTVLRYDAPREEWLKARMTGVGGSEIGILLGMATWKSRYELWQIKTGQVIDAAASAYMERGADIEPIVLRKFSKYTGLATRRQGLVQSRRNPRMLFSVDALAEDGATVEGKVVSQWARDKWVNQKTGEKRPPSDYEWQVRHGLAVMGKTRGYIAALDADSWELEVYEVEAGSQDYDICNDTVNEFWHYVSSGEAPPIDYATATPEEMLSRFPAEVIDPGTIAEAPMPEQALADLARLKEIRGLASAYRRCEKEEAAIKTRVELLIGEKEFLGVPDGKGGLRPVAHWKSVAQKQFHQRVLEASEPDVFERYVTRGRTRRLEILLEDAA